MADCDELDYRDQRTLIRPAIGIAENIEINGNPGWYLAGGHWRDALNRFVILGPERMPTTARMTGGSGATSTLEDARFAEAVLTILDRSNFLHRGYYTDSEAGVSTQSIQSIQLIRVSLVCRDCGAESGTCLSFFVAGSANSSTPGG